jgi:hypothetical protein
MIFYVELHARKNHNLSRTLGNKMQHCAFFLAAAYVARREITSDSISFDYKAASENP